MIEQHMKCVTPSLLKNWKEHDAFIPFASSVGIHGQVEIGVNGKGYYAVKLHMKTGKNTTSHLMFAGENRNVHPISLLALQSFIHQHKSV